MSDFDWEAHRIRPVTCVIRQRPTYNGRPIKPSALKLEGMTVPLVLFWYMGEDDPYPGEFALGNPHGEDNDILRDVGQIGWIASGDVEVLENTPT